MSVLECKGHKSLIRNKNVPIIYRLIYKYTYFNIKLYFTAFYYYYFTFLIFNQVSMVIEMKKVWIFKTSRICVK